MIILFSGSFSVNSHAAGVIGIPSISFTEESASISLRPTEPLTVTSYFFATWRDGCIISFAKSPSSVMSSKPSESMSSLPTGYTLLPAELTSIFTLFLPFSSFIVVTYPRGLLSIIYDLCSPRGNFTALPMNSTLSRLGSILCPFSATIPFTVTLPEATASSALLLLIIPQSAIYF